MIVLMSAGAFLLIRQFLVRKEPRIDYRAMYREANRLPGMLALVLIMVVPRLLPERPGWLWREVGFAPGIAVALIADVWQRRRYVESIQEGGAA